MVSFTERIEKLNNMIKESNYVVFYGGAGVSTESGIPDFRSKDGLYNQKDVKFDDYSAEYLLSRRCLYNEPKVFYEFYRQKLDCREVDPNTAHYKLAELERKGKLKAIITQNIDGLHQKAGSSEVYEIHGTTKKNYCSKCKKEYPSDYIFTSTEPIPKCECRGLIRPDVVLYGETLPKEAWEKSENAIQKADLLIIGGTSLTVYPAKNLISYYYGKNMVIINHDKTEFDQWADLVFHENIGDVFSKIEV